MAMKPKCKGPSDDWQSERPGPCNEPVDPSSKYWCRFHHEERRAYYSRRFKELGGLISGLRRTPPHSAKGRREWIRRQFAQLNQEMRSGNRYKDAED